MSDKPLMFGLPDGEPETKAERTVCLELFVMLVNAGLVNRVHNDLLQYVAKGVKQYLDGETPWKLKQGTAAKGDPRVDAKIVFEAHILPLWRSAFDQDNPISPTAVARALDINAGESNERQARRAVHRALNDSQWLERLQPELEKLADTQGWPKGKAVVVNRAIRWMTPEQEKLYFDDMKALNLWLRERRTEIEQALADKDFAKVESMLNRDNVTLDWQIEWLERRGRMLDAAYDFPAESVSDLRAMAEYLQSANDLSAMVEYLESKWPDGLALLTADEIAKAFREAKLHQISLAAYTPVPRPES